MPFALNEATEFINPTKALEYMATGRPIVQHGGAGCGPTLAPSPRSRTHDEFIALCREALEQPDEGDRAGTGTGARNSWESIVAQLEGQMKKPFQTPAHPGIRMIRTTIPIAAHSGKVAMFDYLIVGAGYAGSVLAERLARGSGKQVLLVDRRAHIGGNAYDCYDDAGILVHKYGPHIFHTNSKEVFDYLSRFTEWRPYQHKVLASVDGQLVPIPINLDTINQLYGLNLNSFQMEEFLAIRAENLESASAPPKTSW